MRVEELHAVVPLRSRRTMVKRGLWCAVAAGLFALLVFPSLVGSESASPAGSSFSTDGDGVAAFADVAQQLGYPVTQRRTHLAGIGPTGADPIPSATTLVILSSNVSGVEGEAVAAFVRNGGRLIAEWTDDSGWLRSLTDGTISREPAAMTPGATSEQVRDASLPARGIASQQNLRVVGSGTLSMIDPQGSQTLAERGGLPIVVRHELGRGSVVAVADASFLSNDLLDLADNAGFAISLVGPRGTPIVFAEQSHGYGPSLTPSGLPGRIKWFLGGLLVSTLALMWTQGKRNGAPEIPAAHQRGLGPPRSAYLRSLAAEVDRALRVDRAISLPRSTVVDQPNPGE